MKRVTEAEWGIRLGWKAGILERSEVEKGKLWEVVQGRSMSEQLVKPCTSPTTQPKTKCVDTLLLLQIVR